MISMTNRMATASISYSFMVEKTLKAKHVNTKKNLWGEKKRIKKKVRKLEVIIRVISS